MDFVNKLAPGASEGILPSSREVFEKKRVETPKGIVFGHFWKIVELNSDMLEPSLFSEIDNWSLKCAQS